MYIHNIIISRFVLLHTLVQGSCIPMWQLSAAEQTSISQCMAETACTEDEDVSFCWLEFSLHAQHNLKGTFEQPEVCQGIRK
jgi:hypothetical protein